MRTFPRNSRDALDGVNAEREGSPSRVPAAPSVAEASQGNLGSRGDAYDNALAETFWSTLDRELLADKVFLTRDVARMEVFQYIEGCFNPWRRHSSLGHLSPADSSASGALRQSTRELRSPSPDPSTKPGQGQLRVASRLWTAAHNRARCPAKRHTFFRQLQLVSADVNTPQMAPV